MKLYFHCMDTADFETAKGLFAQDAIYIRSPLGGTPDNPFAATGVEPVEGLPAIEDFWARRGKKPTHHDIQRDAVDGRDWWAEGEAWVGDDDSDRRSFLCHATLDGEGLIKRFIAIR
jgi:hypothetical protein